MTRTAALIATGDELLLGTTVDTNSGWLASRLADLGWAPERAVVLGDDEDALAALLRELCPRHPLVIVTGGLGPTLDDVTRSAAARAAGVELELAPDVLLGLREWFAGAGRPFAASNERQAWFPRGAEVLANAHGTAPGFALGVGGARVFALPGPPREMRPMFEAEVVPRLGALGSASGATETRTFYLFGLSESAFADLSGPWMERGANPLVGVTASRGVLSVRLRARGATRAEARGLADALAAAMRERFAEHLFSESEPDPARALGHELLARGVAVATAESCTGGLVAEKLTRVPGISAVFSTGFVTYADAAKAALLGVAPELLARHGAVSREVAEAMARGAARAAGARAAIAVTGIAGPGGGSAEKPVGMVWIATILDGEVESAERRFAVRGRELVRDLAANTACDLLRRRIARLPRPDGEPQLREGERASDRD